MIKKAAEALAKNNGIIKERYSGKLMLGAETTAVVFDTEVDFKKAIAKILNDDDQDTRKAVSDAVQNLSTDSFGKQIIVY
jgi:hypothetical protein